MSGPLVELVRQHYRGDVAFRHVAEISQHHRIQASPGYWAAAAYVAAQLEAAGLEVAVRRYPARPGVRFWSTPSFLEWSCSGATLHLLSLDGETAGSLLRLDPAAAGHLDEWRAEIAVVQDRSACWVETAAHNAGVTAVPSTAPAEGEASWRQEALSVQPRRTTPGPIDAGMVLQSMGPEHAAELEQLVEEAGAALHDTSALMQYWADGTRTVAAIADYVELESGHADGGLALRYFTLLARTGLVELLPARP